MRIYTVTCDGQPAAVVRAEDPAEAVAIARELMEDARPRGVFAAREPNDAEMVSWLEHRTEHLLPEAALLVDAG